MSNFTGVTFAQQKVLPSDDAIIRRATLSDGVLFGCEISYSGSTLTMGSGQMLICGRQIRHPAAQNWAVVDATSGFARLVLTVDLTRTASKDVFDQVVDSIEYATSQDGFPELVQEDVNVSGTRYQVAACVVSLGAGGITGIVDQIGAVEASGGGGGLNFSVVGGLTQPADHKENTIWVETNVDITDWIFSATEPEAPADGKDGPVWIATGTSSPVEFNALKKNGIQVYPISAKQYIGGAWVDVTAKSYQGGEWVEWVRYLYNIGNEYVNITGGWGIDGYKNSAYTIVAGTKQSEYFELSGASGKLGVMGTINTINVDNVDKIWIDVEPTGTNSTGNRSINLAVSRNKGTMDKTELAVANFAELKRYTEFLDVSGISGEVYIITTASAAAGCKGKVHSIWLS